VQRPPVVASPVSSVSGTPLGFPAVGNRCPELVAT
jgi:hypothetical protein